MRYKNVNEDVHRVISLLYMSWWNFLEIRKFERDFHIWEELFNFRFSGIIRQACV